MKKRLLFLAAVATLSLGLCGCESREEKEQREKYEQYQENLEQIQESMDNMEENHEYLESILGNTTESSSDEADEAVDGSVSTVPAERGQVVDGVFTNEVFKLSFPVEDSWYVCNDQEIAQILGITSTSLENNEDLTPEMFEEITSGTIYDVIFYFDDMQSNVNIGYINMENIGPYASLPDTDYAELTKNQLESMSATQYTISDIMTETYGGKEWAGFEASTDKGFDQKMVMRKENGYMIVITATYFPEDADMAQAFFDSFIEIQ